MEKVAIKLETLPVISHALIEIGANVTKRILDLNIENLIATDDTVQGLKKLRAELNAELSDYETQRKAVKEGILNPYNEFEVVYKTEISEKYKNAIETLKDKIAIVEDKIKSEKKANIEAYFAELCQSYSIDFLNFTSTGFEINLSTSEKQYKEKCNEFVSKVSDDIALIKTTEFEAEVLVEYKKTLNASKAITEVHNRKEAERKAQDAIIIKEQERRKAALLSIAMPYIGITKTYEYNSDIFITASEVESMSKNDFDKKIIELKLFIQAFQQQTREALNESATQITQQPTPEPIKAPVVEKTEPILTASFECKGTRAQLLALGAYMKENNITYINI